MIIRITFCSAVPTSAQVREDYEDVEQKPVESEIFQAFCRHELSGSHFPSRARIRSDATLASGLSGNS